MKTQLNLLGKLFILLLIGSFPFSNALGQTYTVTNLGTGGSEWVATCSNATPFAAGTFTEGVRQLNMGLATKITFGVTGTINLSARSAPITICANDVVIEGLAGVIITGNTYQEVIVVTGNNDTIRNLEIRGGVMINGGDGNYISGCNINHAAADLDGIELQNSANNNTLLNNTIAFTGASPSRMGIEINSGSSTNTITGNTVSGFIHNIRLIPETGGPNMTGNIITNNTATSPALNGHNIYLADMGGFGPRNTNVSNNTFSNANQTNVYYRNLVSSHGNYLLNNTITGSISNSGITIENSSTTLVDGNIINNNAFHGVRVESSSNVILINNKVGTDATGTIGMGNKESGIWINGGSGHVIGRRNAGNLVSDNGNGGSVFNVNDAYGQGIHLTNVTNSSVKGNKVGTNLAGTSTTGADGQPLGNHLNGIYLEFACQNDSIGGILSGEENIVGGNGFAHVGNFPFATRSGIQLIDDGATVNQNNFILGNFCGTNSAGTDLGNAQEGITLYSSSNNIVGGTTSAYANKVCYNTNGISLRFGANSNTLYGNFVGTLDGVSNNANSDAGITLENNCNNNMVGGAFSGQGNTIRFNGRGMWLVNTASQNLIHGNTISNNTGRGIEITNGASENRIGDWEIAGSGNTISNNGGDAIYVHGTTSVRNRIRTNSIFCNAGMGINLNYGVDQGNAGYPAPVINSSTTTSSHIEGTALPGDTIDLYYVSAGCVRNCSDALKPEGEQWISFVVADASGDWSYDAAFTREVTATATGGYTGFSSNTSEFATCAPGCPLASPAVAGADENLCGVTSVALDADDISSGTGTWEVLEDGGATLSFDPNDPETTVSGLPANDTVTLRWVVSTGVGCPVNADTLSILTTATPSAPTIVGQTTTCDEVTGLTYGVSPVVTGATYTWNIQSGGATIDGSSAGNSITVDFPTGAASGTIEVDMTLNACNVSNTLGYTVNNRPSTPIITGDDESCDEVAGLSFSADPLIPGATYTWTLPLGATIDGASDGNVITVDLAAGASSGQVTVVASLNGCADTSSSKSDLTVNNRPSTPLITGPVAVCELSSNITFSADPSISNATYVWSVPTGATINGATNGNSISVDFPAGTTSGNVTVSASLEGCADLTESSSALQVDEEPSDADAGSDQLTLCPDNTVLNANDLSSGIGSGRWFIVSGVGTITDDENPATGVTAIEVGTLSLEWVISNGVCTEKRDTVVIERQPQVVQADAGADRPTCATSVELEGNDPGTGYSGEWSPLTLTFSDIHDPNATVSGLAPGANIITWTITGPCGNSSKDVIITSGTSSVDIVAVADKDTLCAGSPSSITATVIGTSATPLTYIWTSTDNSFNTTYEAGTTSTIDVTPSAAGWVKYSVLVVDDNGCGDTTEDSVYSVGSQALKIPNLITPNGDERNDCLQILDKDGFNIVPGSVYQIYNRWEQSVYKNDNYANGDFCGSDLADGMYYFYLKTSCDNREFKGWLHILSNTGASNK